MPLQPILVGAALARIDHAAHRAGSGAEQLTNYFVGQIVAHTLALWNHVPVSAWLLTVDGGSHLGTFTTDPDRGRVDAIIVDFVLPEVEHDPTAAARLASASAGRLHIRRR